MIKLQNISTPLHQADTPPLGRIARLLGVAESAITRLKLDKRSVDARKKTELCFCDTYLVTFSDAHIETSVLKRNKNAIPFEKKAYIWPKTTIKPQVRPIVVGSGPAGLFAALTLCRAGVPVTVIERGQAVEQRIKTVDAYWSGGILHPNSNVQFGEGGAGTFSDGKLNTGIKDPRCRTVLETFHAFGAKEDILVKGKPHIGTDVLRDVVRNIRNEILSLGGEYLFETEFLQPIYTQNQLTSILCKNNNGDFELPCNHLILAIGNAARNTYRSLWECGMTIQPKPFAIGVRIEHLQKNINLAQYGDAPVPPLPPAEYKLATHLASGRGVYTFCMCPGGVVVNAASERETYVTNGMSYQSRSGKNANAALLVGIDEADFLKTDDGSPFGGLLLQEQIERAAFAATDGRGLPAQTVGSFLNHTKPTANFADVLPTALPGVFATDLDNVLPLFITEALREALPLFDRKIHGFADPNAILTAPETRSSSPVRLLRNEAYCSNLTGIYPCGEGAGYAGGITSSAVDGIRTAEAVLAAFSE